MDAEMRHEIAEQLTRTTRPREFYDRIGAIITELNQLTPEDAAALREATQRIVGMTAAGMSEADLENQRLVTEWAYRQSETKSETNRGFLKNFFGRRK